MSKKLPLPWIKWVILSLLSYINRINLKKTIIMNQNKCVIKKAHAGDNFPGVPGPLLSPTGFKHILKTAKILQASMGSF